MFRALLFCGVAAMPMLSVSPALALAHVDTSVQNNPVPYPAASQSRREEGVVRLFVKVSDSGKPISAKIVKSSGFDDLDTAAMSGVLNWHYTPSNDDHDWADVQVEYKMPPRALPPPPPVQ